MDLGNVRKACTFVKLRLKSVFGIIVHESDSNDKRDDGSLQMQTVKTEIHDQIMLTFNFRFPH